MTATYKQGVTRILWRLSDLF